MGCCPSAESKDDHEVPASYGKPKLASAQNRGDAVARVSQPMRRKARDIDCVPAQNPLHDSEELWLSSDPSKAGKTPLSKPNTKGSDHMKRSRPATIQNQNHPSMSPKHPLNRQAGEKALHVDWPNVWTGSPALFDAQIPFLHEHQVHQVVKRAPCLVHLDVLLQVMLYLQRGPLQLALSQARHQLVANTNIESAILGGNASCEKTACADSASKRAQEPAHRFSNPLLVKTSPSLLESTRFTHKVLFLLCLYLSGFPFRSPPITLLVVCSSILSHPAPLLSVQQAWVWSGGKIGKMEKGLYN